MLDHLGDPDEEPGSGCQGFVEADSALKYLKESRDFQDDTQYTYERVFHFGHGMVKADSRFEPCTWQAGCASTSEPAAYRALLSQDEKERLGLTIRLFPPFAVEALLSPFSFLATDDSLKVKRRTWSTEILDSLSRRPT